MKESTSWRRAAGDECLHLQVEVVAFILGECVGKEAFEFGLRRQRVFGLRGHKHDNLLVLFCFFFFLIRRNVFESNIKPAVIPTTFFVK